MDLRKLKKLIDLVEASGISELELTEGEEKVKISRNSGYRISHNCSSQPQLSSEVQPQSINTDEIEIPAAY